MEDVLRLLRLVALLMLLTLAPVGIALLNIATPSSAWLWWGRLGLALAPIIFVFIPGLERRLGQYYLPVALFLFISTLGVELTVQSSGYLARRFLAQTGRNADAIFGSWRGEMFLFLLVPIVLTAWAYGRKGAVRAAAWATVLHIGGGVWLWSRDGAFPEGYWKAMPIRLTVLYVVPLVVAYLATRQRRQHEALEAAHGQLQRQAALAEELAASRERNRLARDLHDTLAHSLAGLVVELEAVGTLFELDPAATQVELRKAQALARAGLDEARAAIRDLRESPTQDLGLGPALRRLVDDFGRRTGMETRAEFSVSGPDPALPPKTADALYRIAQEALSNVERHARASLVTLRVESTRAGIALTISDDGAGFEPDNPTDGHFGLLGMHERAEMIGAKLHVESGAGTGTRIRVKLDLE